jgi:ComF family protein
MRITRALSSAVNALGSVAVEFLYPQRCIACGRFGAPLCTACEAGLQELAVVSGCPRCASPPAAGEANCRLCLAWDAIDAAFPAFVYEGTARKLVHALKYARQRSVVPHMAARMAGPAQLPAIDAAFAVPLHPARFRRRGFNQARHLLQALAWPEPEGRLRRIRNTRSQVGLNPGDRRANVAEAFAYAGPPLNGLSVAVIDDVITTGATVNECARILRVNGAASVSVVSFARAKHTPRPPEAPIED